MIQCGQTWVFQHLEIEKYQVLTGNLATNSGTNKRTYSFTFENDYNSPFIFSELIIVKHVPRFIFTPSVTMKQFTPRNVARKNTFLLLANVQTRPFWFFRLMRPPTRNRQTIFEHLHLPNKNRNSVTIRQENKEYFTRVDIWTMW